jgi:hypothetical protein
MGDVAYRQDVLDKQRFADYIIKHHRSWLTFVNDLGRGHLSLSDLILVTGCDKTSQWACAVWSEKTRSARLSFVAGAPGIAEGSATLWGSWASSQIVDEHVGPQPLGPVADRSSQSISFNVTSIGESPPLEMSSNVPPLGRSSKSNQCVFLRGFRMSDRRTFFKSKAAAGDALVTIRKPSHSKKQDSNNSTAGIAYNLANSMASSNRDSQSQGTPSQTSAQTSDIDADIESSSDEGVTFDTYTMLNYGNVCRSLFPVRFYFHIYDNEAGAHTRDGGPDRLYIRSLSTSTSVGHSTDLFLELNS